MGQKINPISLRLQVNKKWPSRWFFASKGTAIAAGRRSYIQLLEEDETIRRVVREKISQAGIAGLEVERTSNNLRVVIRTARPGLVIGQGGKGIEELSKALKKALLKVRLRHKDKTPEPNLSVNVEELKRSEVAAPYVAQQIAWDLERRLPFRRTIKKHLESVSQNREVKGVKIMVKGRLDGSEIARQESLKFGALPLQTLRADIDYGTATSKTTYGTIGVKVWIYKGEVFGKKENKQEDKNSK